jgi:hypothetical protein
MRWLLVAALVAAASGCAPTSMSPMVIRMMPGEPTRPTNMVGVRSGPRLSTPMSASRTGSSTLFPGDSNIFAPPQWGLAYDVNGTFPFEAGFAAHLGLQGEFIYPLPLPAYGLYAGVSRYMPFGKASIGPALTGRFATDFGIPTNGGPGTQLGGDLSVTLAFHPEEKVSIGIVPFVSYDHVWTPDAGTHTIYTGAALVVRLVLSGQSYELSGGFGRVFLPGTDTSWNAPIMGVRVGR